MSVTQQKQSLVLDYELLVYMRHCRFLFVELFVWTLTVAVCLARVIVHSIPTFRGTLKIGFKIVRGLFLPLALSVAGSAIAGKDECKDVLKDGTRAASLYSSRFEYRRLLESHLVNMTYEQAKTDTSLTGSIPIGDIILGAGFDRQTFHEYKNYLQQDTALRVDISRSLDIMLSTGDPEILRAWSECMKSRIGLSLYFTEVHATSAVLNLEWHAGAGVPRVKVKQDYSLPRDVKVSAGRDILNGKEFLVAGTSHQVKFEFNNAVTPFSFTINVEKDGGGLAGADSAYLPTRLEPYLQLRPFQFSSGQCDKSPLLAVDTLRHTGNSASARFCSNGSSGWRFARTSLQVLTSVAIPGQLPGTFSNYQTFWSGDFQVTVVLGCSNSSGTDIQCQGHTSLQEERWLWKLRQDYQAFESVKVGTGSR